MDREMVLNIDLTHCIWLGLAVLPGWGGWPLVVLYNNERPVCIWS